MTTPALNIPIRVTGQEEFKKRMNETSSLTRHVAQVATTQIIRMNAGWLAQQGAIGAATVAAGRFLSLANRLLLSYAAIKSVFMLMGYATDLAKAKIKEFNEVADKANASGFSTEFFQRITKSSGEARDKVDELSESLVNFNKASAPKLGGSELQNRIDELKKAGNLSGNTGLAAFVSANDAEARLRAIVSLINQAMQAGERLAALDLAQRAFGPQITAALRADSGYLDDMLKRADALSKTKIVSQEDLGRAIELKQRLEDAQKVLSEKFKPIQDDLAKLGFNYRENWADITESLAAAVGYATQLYSALKQVPDLLADKIGGASIWTSLTNATGAMGLNSTPESMGLIEDHGQMAANAKLRAALQNHANVTKGMREATDVQSAVRGDTSKNPVPDKTAEKNQFDKASEAIEQHTAKMRVDAEAVGLGASALEQLRAAAKLLTAAQQAGLPVNDALIAKIDRLAKSAGEAGEKLAEAKVNSEIQFGSRTALLSPEDAAIARQLAGIYGNDVPAALASSQAAALRFNGALQQVSTSIQGGLVTGLADIFDGTKSVSQGFADMGRLVIRAIEEMVIKMRIVAPIMKGLQGALGLGFADGGLVTAPLAKANGGYITGPGTARSDSIPARLSNGEFVVNAGATAKHRAVLEAINGDRIPRFADGGIVGNTPSMPMIGGSTIVAPTIAVSVQGSPGMSQADHQKMGENIGKAAMDHVRELMTKEIYNQRRPGGLLQARR
ncbi:hypothetical protein Nham_2477 [Nitrobacter hamburgensis X14]|uniref:Bacteriophage tail tape measure C-terminal domain-containing protein n=1 Tax=Nitrobacter hamburgensis (strain DSM 10229 / NCIMB 13809 / X14) TaxID=323097 RepID=Q1QKI0_NITHX|nr:hypothetical protein [Nitrobacter hamburgensis]ABE63267.1 hypothetical protein Nham_2477 [Nitrobacter hamburgensis X14]